MSLQQSQQKLSLAPNAPMAMTAQGSAADFLSTLSIGGQLLTIEIRSGDNYVNATRIGQMAGDAKRWTFFERSDRCRHLITQLGTHLSTVLDCTLELVSIDTHKPVGQRFTWIHPDLAVPYVAWVAPAFELAVSRHIQAFMRGEVTTEQSQEVKAQIEKGKSVETASTDIGPQILPPIIRTRYVNPPLKGPVLYHRRSLSHYLPGAEILPGKITECHEKLGMTLDFDSRRGDYETGKDRDFGYFSHLLTTKSHETAKAIEGTMKKCIKSAKVGNHSEYYDVSAYLQNHEIYSPPSNALGASKACWDDLLKKTVRDNAHLIDEMWKGKVAVEFSKEDDRLVYDIQISYKKVELPFTNVIEDAAIRETETTKRKRMEVDGEVEKEKVAAELAKERERLAVELAKEKEKLTTELEKERIELEKYKKLQDTITKAIEAKMSETFIAQLMGITFKPSPCQLPQPVVPASNGVKEALKHSAADDCPEDVDMDDVPDDVDVADDGEDAIARMKRAKDNERRRRQDRERTEISVAMQHASYALFVETKLRKVKSNVYLIRPDGYEAYCNFCETLRDTPPFNENWRLGCTMDMSEFYRRIETKFTKWVRSKKTTNNKRAWRGLILV